MKKFFFLTTLAVLLATAQNANAKCAHNGAQTTSSKIVLSELLPSPISGEEEFIELHNTGKKKVDVAGWKLVDASGKTYDIEKEDVGKTVIKAGAYLAIPQSASGIYLNNGSDGVTLLQANDKKRSSTEYLDAPSGQSWASVNGTWQWTTVTRGKKNVAASGSGDTSEPGAAGETAYETSSSVLLSELLPDPEGSDATDEWIAVVNSGSTAVNLAGWTLRDGSKEYVVDSATIAAGEELIFSVAETKISLNNSGETIELVDPFDAVIDSTTYADGESGWSWARYEADWNWTSEPTPGAANILATSEDGSSDEAGSESESGGGDSGVISITEFRGLEDDASGTVEGVVSVAVGVLGSQYIYMQDADAGVQVYSYNKDFPDVAVGTHVTVSGTKSTNRQETRLKTSSIDDFVVNGEGALEARAVTALDETVEGMLVSVSGTVTDKSGDEVLIDGAHTIVIKDTVTVDMELLAEGNSVTVTGIVGQSNEEYRLMPRAQEDIRTSSGAEAAAVSAGGVSDGQIEVGQFEEAPMSKSARNAAGAAAGLLSLGSGLAWRSEKAREWIKDKMGMATQPPVQTAAMHVDTVQGPPIPPKNAAAIEKPPLVHNRIEYIKPQNV